MDRHAQPGCTSICSHQASRRRGDLLQVQCLLHQDPMTAYSSLLREIGLAFPAAGATLTSWLGHLGTWVLLPVWSRVLD